MTYLNADQTLTAREFIAKARVQEGRMTFDEREFESVLRRDYDSERDWLNALVQTYCSPLDTLVSIDFERAAGANKRAGVTYNRGLVSFDIAPVLLLDNSSPSHVLAGLDLVKVFLDICADFYTEYPERHADIRILNKRDRHNKTYATVSCWTYRNAVPCPAHATKYEDLIKDLAEDFSQFGKWLRVRALDLNRLGPLSSVLTISAHMLFADDVNPVRAAEIKRRELADHA